MDENNEITTRINEFTNLLYQMHDIDALKAANCISDDDYTEMKAKKMAYIAALNSLNAGEDTYVEQSKFEELLAQMRDVAAEPTQEEINAAYIDYLMMVGGEWE